MPVSISPSIYPDLWDRIIADTSFATQLSLRLVCKSARLAIDRGQAHHLVISAIGRDGLLVTTPHRHLPYFSDTSMAIWSKPGTAEVLAYTRIVDIRGFVPPPVDLTTLSPLFPNLAMVRICNSGPRAGDFTPYVPFKAKTLVLFQSPAGLDTMMEHEWFKEDVDKSPSRENEEKNDAEEEDKDEDDSDSDSDSDDFDFGSNSDDEDGEGPRMVPAGVKRGKLPDSYTKLVIAMNGHDLSITDTFEFTRDPPETVREVVIVAPAYAFRGDPGRMRDLYPVLLPGDVLRIVNDAAVSFTLVGFDRVKPGYAAELRRFLREDFSGTLWPDVDYTIDDALTRAMPADVRQRCIDTSEAQRQEQTWEKKADGVAFNPPPLVGYKAKVTAMHKCFKLVSKNVYAKQVGEMRADLHMLEFLDTRDYARGRDWRSTSL